MHGDRPEPDPEPHAVEGEGPPSVPGEHSLFAEEAPGPAARLPSAADDPTAVWDEGSLHRQGMGEVVGLEGGPETAPATAPGAGGRASSPRVEAQPPVAADGLSWTATVALALALGAAAFALFYFLR